MRRLRARRSFGPVLSLMHADTIEEAIALVNGRSYGNMACIFTTDGANARRFRYEVNAGNVGINVGVAAPMSTFPFSGWGESFFGDLHAQAHHGSRVLHADEGRRRALAPGLEPEVLRTSCGFQVFRLAVR